MPPWVSWGPSARHHTLAARKFGDDPTSQRWGAGDCDKPRQNPWENWRVLEASKIQSTTTIRAHSPSIFGSLFGGIELP